MRTNPPILKIDSRVSSGSRAFTLIEILLAIAIFGIVLVAINTVFYSALRLRNHSAIMVDSSHIVEQGLAVVRRDLQNTIPPDGLMSQWFIVGPVSPYAPMNVGNRTGGGNVNTNTSDVSMTGVTQTGMNILNNQAITSGGMQTFGVQFFTTTAIVNDIDSWGELQRVTLQLQPPLRRDDPGNDLVRSVSRVLLASTPIEEPTEERILTGVEAMDIECYTGIRWLNYWDTTMGDEGIPKAIRLRIQFAAQSRNAPSRPPIEMLIPFSVQSLTNQVDMTETNETQNP